MKKKKEKKRKKKKKNKHTPRPGRTPLLLLGLALGLEHAAHVDGVARVVVRRPRVLVRHHHVRARQRPQVVRVSLVGHDVLAV